jgi:hypothetical protein
LYVYPDQIESIRIRPDGATIWLGATQTYTVEGYGPGHRSLGDVTAEDRVHDRPDRTV